MDGLGSPAFQGPPRHASANPPHSRSRLSATGPLNLRQMRVSAQRVRGGIPEPQLQTPNGPLLSQRPGRDAFDETEVGDPDGDGNPRLEIEGDLLSEDDTDDAKAGVNVTREGVDAQSFTEPWHMPTSRQSAGEESEADMNLNLQRQYTIPCTITNIICNDYSFRAMLFFVSDF